MGWIKKILLVFVVLAIIGALFGDDTTNNSSIDDSLNPDTNQNTNDESLNQKIGDDTTKAQEEKISSNPMKIVQDDKTSITFTDDTFNTVISNPDQYKGSLVEITGQIFTNPEINNDLIAFQMYQGGKFDLNRNVIVAYQGSLGFQAKTEDCIKVKGSVGDKFEGQNAFGATIKAVTVKATNIEKLDCKDVIYPTMKTVTIEKTQNKNDVSVTLQKIEFAKEHTRVYLKIENNADDKIHFYGFNAVAFQDKKQFKTTSVFDVEYQDIDSEIFAGIEEEGVILFEPLDYTKNDAKFQFEVTSNDYITDEYIFNVIIQ